MFELGTHVKVTSGPHKRSGEMVVEGVEGDRFRVFCPKLDTHFTFPTKLLKPIRGADILQSPIPPVANGSYVPCDPAKLKAGDRIKQAGDPFELKFKTYETHTGTILASFKLPDGDHRTVRVAAGGVLVLQKDMPEKVVELTPEKTERDDVLYAFAVEPEQGRETLEKYLKDYPQYAAELVDLSHELSRTCEDESPLSDQDLASIDRAWERHKSAEPQEQTILDKYGKRLAVGDRVTAAWQSGKFIYYGVIESFSGKIKPKAHGRWTVGRRGGDGDQFSVAPDQLIKVPKDGALSLSQPQGASVTDYGHIPEPLKIGDRVHFRQYWHGQTRDFEGVVAKVDQPPGTVIVDYTAPPEYEVKNPLRIQAPIATFSREKVAMGEDKPPVEPAYSFGSSEFPESEVNAIAAEIAKIRAEGPVAQNGCWIEFKKHKCDFVEAIYKARSAIFPSKRDKEVLVKSLYIGKFESDAYYAAVDAVRRRNKINDLRKQLEKCNA